MRFLHVGDLCLWIDGFNGICSKIFLKLFFSLEIARHGPLGFPLKKRKTNQNSFTKKVSPVLQTMLS